MNAPMPNRTITHTSKESKEVRRRLRRASRHQAKTTLQTTRDGDAIERTRRTEGWHTW